VIERLFGRRLLSIRRFISTAAIICFSFCLTIIESVMQSASIPSDRIGEFNYFWFNNLIWLVLLFLSTSISLSITRFAAAQAGKFLNKRPYLNVLGLAALLYLQYLIFISFYLVMDGIQISIAGNIQYFIGNFHAMTWPSVLPIAAILIKSSINSTAMFVWGALTDQSLALHPIHGIRLITIFLTRVSERPDLFFIQTAYKVNAIPTLIRVSIAIIFVGSFLLQILQRPIMALWARIIESDKPVFTILFSGAAAITKGMQEIIKGLT
jgi:hypothetical protein